MVFHLLRERKAQVNIEFIVAVVLLAFVLISTVIFTIRLLPAFSSELEEANLRARATALENLLLYSPGVPINWTSSPAVIGLAAANNNSNETILGALDPTKLVQLNTSPDLNYSSLKNNLNLSDVDFYLKISSTWGILDYFNHTPAEAQRVVSMNKMMVIINNTLKINKTEANVTLLVW